MHARTLSVLLFALAFAGCGDSSGPEDSAEVAVDDDLFSPSALTVSTGTTVTWRWEGSNSHNVTWVDAIPASATQTQGTYSRRFDTPGPYQYYCTIHGTPSSGMHGTLTVQ